MFSSPLPLQTSAPSEAEILTKCEEVLELMSLHLSDVKHKLTAVLDKKGNR